MRDLPCVRGNIVTVYQLINVILTVCYTDLKIQAIGQYTDFERITNSSLFHRALKKGVAADMKFL